MYLNISKIFSSNILISILGIIAGVILARLLKVEERGQLAEIVLWSTMLASINSEVFREFILSNKNFSFINKRLLFYSSILCSTIVAFYLLAAGYGTNLYYPVIFGLVNVYTMLHLTNYHLKCDFHNLSKYKLVIPAIYPILLLLYFFIFEELTINVVLITNLISNILLLFLLSRNKEQPKLLKKKIKTIPLKKILPVASTVTLFALATQLDKVVTSKLLSSEVFAEYVVAMTICFTPLSIIANTMSTYIIVTVKREGDDNRLVLSKVVFISLLVLIAMSSFIFIISPYLVSIIFGERYMGVLKILPSCIVISCVISIRIVMHNCLRGMGLNNMIYKIHALSITIVFLGLLLFSFFNYLDDTVFAISQLYLTSMLFVFIFSWYELNA